MNYLWVGVRGMAKRKASPADLLAAVRAAVEDGTIGGEVNQIEDRTYLVIPVSDGGSET
jgi:hypothetical protein